jgi:hypothetical protein
MANLKSVLAAFGIAVVVGGCAASPALLAGDAPPHITKVVVAKTAPLGSVNMAEDLRVKILQRAPAYAPVGTPKTLDVQITTIGFKNPLAALLVSDSNRLTVSVRVVDGATGKVDASYETIAIDSAAINGIAGAIMSAADDPIDIEQRLNDVASRNVLNKLYGTETARLAAERPQSNKITAQYPRNYADLKTEARCKTLLDANEASAANPNDHFHGKTAPLPPECAAVGVVAKPVKKRV